MQRISKTDNQPAMTSFLFWLMMKQKQLPSSQLQWMGIFRKQIETERSQVVCQKLQPINDKARTSLWAWASQVWAFYTLPWIKLRTFQPLGHVPLAPTRLLIHSSAFGKLTACKREPTPSTQNSVRPMVNDFQFFSLSTLCHSMR